MNDKSWRDYLRPQRYTSPYRPVTWKVKVATPIREAAWIEEQHAEVAEYRLRHDGIKPELLAYLDGIGRAYR